MFSSSLKSEVRVSKSFLNLVIAAAFKPMYIYAEQNSILF